VVQDAEEQDDIERAKPGQIRRRKIGDDRLDCCPAPHERHRLAHQRHPTDLLPYPIGLRSGVKGHESQACHGTNNVTRSIAEPRPANQVTPSSTMPGSSK
jgi:hypothetical protein